MQLIIYLPLQIHNRKLQKHRIQLTNHNYPTMAYSIEDKTQIINRICEHISCGMSLRKALKSTTPSIGSETFYLWIDDDKEKAKQYARACEERAEAMADEIIEIADFNANDTLTTEKGDIPDNEWINRSKLRVDTRKWLMSKLQPKKYGDKLDLTSAGEKMPSAPPTINVYNTAPPMASSEEDIDTNRE